MDTPIVSHADAWARYSRFIAALTGVAAIISFGGWAWHVGWVTGPFPGYEATKANASVCLALLSAAVFMLSYERRTPATRWVIDALVILAVLISAATLAEYIFGINFGIDQALLPDASGETHPGRMAPNSAAALIMLGLAIALVARRSDTKAVIAQLLAVASAIIALLGIIGYVYGISGFYEMQSEEMATETAIVVFALAAAVFGVSRGLGFMRIVMGRNAAGFLIRRLLPWVVVLPVVLGWLCLLGQSRGLFDATMGVGLLATSNVVALALLIVINSRFLFRTEATRDRLQEQLRSHLADVERQVAERTSDLHEATERLADSEQRFALAAEGSESGILDLDLASGKMYCSPRWKAMLGLPESETIDSPRAFAELVHPDDREGAMALLMGHYKGAIPSFSTEVRMKHRDGAYRWMLSRGQAVRDESGRAIRMVGSQSDISELKSLQERLQRDMVEAQEAEKRLRASEERFQTIFSSVNDGIFVSDQATGKFIDVNRSGCEMYGYSRDEIIGRDIEFVSAGVPPYTMTEVFEMLKKVMTSGPQTFEWYSRASGNRLFWTEISLSIVAFGTGDVVLAAVRDISLRKRAQQQVEHMAAYDELTDLPNRTSFLKEVRNAIARVRRGAKGFAILYFDLDRFKDVNDTLGHPAGDLLLQGLAERVRRNIREVDTAARFGGDEFAVIATDIRGPADAAVLAAKLLKVIGEPFDINGHAVHSGASIGIDIYGPESPDAETLLAHADEALYRAKAAGRGAYRFFTDATDPRSALPS
ncbi:MAG TPA: diguanylate cyclase [Candidatus Tumulicola sp.]|nr:diguanylate cyclase [Candidatus Tumulicola sp.]